MIKNKQSLLQNQDNMYLVVTHRKAEQLKIKLSTLPKIFYSN